MLRFANRPMSPPSPPPSSGRSRAALALVPLALAFLLYFPTLGLSWAYDDIDYINQAADTLAGQRSLVATLLRPQGEHIVSGFRLVLFASLELFGAAATPFRVFVLLTHAASGFFLGLIARRYSGSTAAGVAAAALYVGACGLSSMWIWFPSGSSVPFALALLTGGTAALVDRDRLGVRRARLLAGAAVVAALLTESTLAPMAALPLLIDEMERRRAGERRPVGAFAIFCALTTVLVAVLVSVLYSRTFGPRLSISLVDGVPRAAFLLLVAPFRLFFPGIPIAASSPGLSTAVLGSLLGLAVAGPVAALLLALWRRGAPRLAGVAALAAIGPLGAVGLVGLGRWRNSYWELYEADRYFFTLLVPLALLAGAVVASLGPALRAWPPRPRWPRAVLLLCLLAGGGAELALHRRAMIGRIPFDIYKAHGRRFAQLSRLAGRLSAASRALPPGAPPLLLPDTDLWFPDVHNGHLTTRVLLHVIGPGSEPRLRLGGPVVGERDARILNPVLAAWGREIGEPLPYLSIAGGRLVDAHVIRLADFRAGPQDAAVVTGFYAWEGSSRWMGGRGELRLTLASTRLVFAVAVPKEALRPGPLRVRVTAKDEALGWSADLGTLDVAQEGIQVLHLPATPFMSRLGAGRIVHLVLQSDRTWKPADTLPGLTDRRDLSVMVFAAGCE
jgi:hypothetical protein